MTGGSTGQRLAMFVTWLVIPAGAQAQTTDWPLHNLDEYNSRYSPLTEINRSNAGRLTLRWSFQTEVRDRIGEATPLVIDGMMYFHSGSKLFAVNAATGESVWTFEAEPAFGGGGRGPAYGDGTIYAYGQSMMYAVDARTGELVQSFGQDGLLRVVSEALTFKYPDTYPPDHRFDEPRVLDDEPSHLSRRHALRRAALLR